MLRHQLKIHCQALFIQNSQKTFENFTLFLSGYYFQFSSFNIVTGLRFEREASLGVTWSDISKSFVIYR